MPLSRHKVPWDVPACRRQVTVHRMWQVLRVSREVDMSLGWTIQRKKQGQDVHTEHTCSPQTSAPPKHPSVPGPYPSPLPVS